MNTHPLKTRSILESFRFPVSLRRVPHVAALHHEKLNGTGYPEGLTGDDLPRLSRIMAVADVFDALTSPRDYPRYDGEEGLGREPMPLEKVVSIIQSGSGGHFDPEVVAAFMRCLPRILRTHRGEHFDPEYVDGMLAETTEEDTGSDGNLFGPD